MAVAESVRKPVRVEVDVSDFLKSLFGGKLIKDLCENEAICPVCHGTGVKVSDNVYGLSEIPTSGIRFPYKHQSVSFCLNCYNGVVRYCPDCGKQLPRGYLRCNCEAELRRKREAERKKEAEELAASVKHDASALGTEFQMCYSSFFRSNEGFFSDWDEFFEDWFEEHDAEDERPEFVWGTVEEKMSLDAHSIVSSACEEMYEDAFDDIGSDAIKQMQAYFDKWLAENGRVTYFVSHKHAVKIPWDQH